MTQSEQDDFNKLRDQLESAKAGAEQVRAYLSNSVERLTQELRLYRGLFWCLLALATVATIINLLQR